MASRLPKTPRKAQLAERRRKVMAMAVSGMAFDRIATAVGVQVPTVRSDVNHCLKDYARHAPETAAYRELNRARLEQLLSKLLPLAEAGNMGAVDRCLNIVKTMNTMLGLNLPATTEQGGKARPHLTLKVLAPDGSQWEAEGSEPPAIEATVISRSDDDEPPALPPATTAD